MEKKITQELFWLISLNTVLTESEREFLFRIRECNKDGKDYQFTPNERNNYIRILEITKNTLTYNLDSINKCIQELKEK